MNYRNSDYLSADQYKTEDNLKARSQLHERYSTAGVAWFEWVFDLLDLDEGMTVLECGGGAGWLWQKNSKRIPDKCQITITDVSEGMVSQAAENLSGVDEMFVFELANIEDLSRYTDDSFDRVVANHMLYHVEHIERGLEEVRRVLRPGGFLMAATNGVDHLKELGLFVKEALGDTAVDLPWLKKFFAESFSLESGSAILEEVFEDVRRFDYEDGLSVTQVEPIVAYILSTLDASDVLGDTQVEKLRAYLDAKLAVEQAIYITKSSGVFLAGN